jgi:hypothetical protein
MAVCVVAGSCSAMLRYAGMSEENAESRSQTPGSRASDGTKADAETMRAEYQQINESYRHDATLSWASGAILVPVSLGAFALIKDASERYMLIGLAVASIFFAFFWCVVMERQHMYGKTRLDRAREIEEALHMRHHLKIKEKTDSEKWYSWPWRTRTLWKLYPIVILGVWVIIWCSKCGSHAANQSTGSVVASASTPPSASGVAPMASTTPQVALPSSLAPAGSLSHGLGLDVGAADAAPVDAGEGNPPHQGSMQVAPHAR